MKKSLLTALQFLLFLFTYAVATFTLPFHRESVFVHTGTLTRIFIWDGVILTLVLFALLLLVEALMKRLVSAAPWTALALALALAAGFALKLGFVTREFSSQFLEHP